MMLCCATEKMTTKVGITLSKQKRSQKQQASEWIPELCKPTFSMSQTANKKMHRACAANQAEHVQDPRKRVDFCQGASNVSPGCYFCNGQWRGKVSRKDIWTCMNMEIIPETTHRARKYMNICMFKIAVDKMRALKKDCVCKESVAFLNSFLELLRSGTSWVEEKLSMADSAVGARTEQDKDVSTKTSKQAEFKREQTGPPSNKSSVEHRRWHHHQSRTQLQRLNSVSMVQTPSRFCRQRLARTHGGLGKAGYCQGGNAETVEVVEWKESNLTDGSALFRSGPKNHSSSFSIRSHSRTVCFSHTVPRDIS